MQKVLPNLIVIGGMKCATTSFHYYLNLHPEISMSEIKELNFFMTGSKGNWNRGIEWYVSNFKGKALIYGETSPSYSSYPIYDRVPERMFETVPNVKLIYLVRNPIDRIVSHYCHDCAAGLENRDISEILRNMESNHYIYRSKYYMQLEQYLKYFQKSNILIIKSESLMKKRRETMKKVFRFLNVDNSFYSNKFLFSWHKLKYKRKKKKNIRYAEQILTSQLFNRLPFEMKGLFEKLLYFPFSDKVQIPELDQRLKSKLVELLKDDINHLRELTGCRFETWSL